MVIKTAGNYGRIDVSDLARFADESGGFVLCDADNQAAFRMGCGQQRPVMAPPFPANRSRLSIKDHAVMASIGANVLHNPMPVPESMQWDSAMSNMKQFYQLTTKGQ